MALPHHQVAVLQRRVGALVAGDHTGRHIQRTHHHHEGGGEVLAKALLAVEPELVDGMAAQLVAIEARRQRVAEAGGADVAQHRVGERGRIGLCISGLAAQRGGPLQRAGVVAGRQGQVVLQAQRGLARAMLEAGPGLHRQAQPVGHRAVGQPFQVGPLQQAPAFDARRLVGTGRGGFQQR